MLTSIQLMLLLFWTSVGSAGAEKLYHRRDRSDLRDSGARRAGVVTDEHAAQLFLSRYGFITPVKWEEPQAEGSAFGFGDAVQEAEGSAFGFGDAVQEAASQRGSRTSAPDGSGSDSDNPASFVSALEEFQRVSGLTVTGVFDEATKEAMNKPRCGVPDKETDRNRTGVFNETDGDAAGRSRDRDAGQREASGGKRRRREAGERGYVAFSKRLLRWRLIGEGYSSQLSVDEQRYVLRTAFRMWSEVSPLDFVEDTRSPLEDVDIRLGFGTGRHLGCNQRFDGTGQEFAHAWFLGDIHFDDDEHFTAPNTGSGISLLKVAVHEIGHVLGLPHIYRPGSIMQPSYLPQESGFEMGWMDRKAIQHLYGGCKGRFSTVFDWIRKEKTPYGEVVIRFNTYFMRDSWYWLYENRNNRTRYGDPVTLQVGWRGLPREGVDAHVHVWSRKKDLVYFFRGTQFWRYDSEKDQVFRQDPEGRRYPRPISEGFPGVAGPIDTAFYDRRDSHIYFFKNSLVYAFNVGANRLARGFPKDIRVAFPAVESGDHPGGNVDAAYFSYTHGAVFLLKGTRFWRVAGGRERRRRLWLPKNGLLPQGEVEEQWFDICNVHPTALKLRR